MSHNWKGRDAWLDDEDALEEYHTGREDEEEENEEVGQKPPPEEFRMRPSDACWDGEISQQDWIDLNK